MQQLNSRCGTAAHVGFEALTRAGSSSIATRFSVDASWTRELLQDRSQEGKEEVPGNVDELFVGEYEPVRYAAADKSGEKQAAVMGIRCGRARCGRAARGCGHPT